MRLFIAITLQEKEKDKLYKSVLDLKAASAQGVFSHRENLHLTLAFLGELPLFDHVVRAMQSLHEPRFSIKIEGLSSFAHSKLYYRKIQAPKTLFSLQRSLCTALQKEGVMLESRSYKPHMTLGRQVRLYPDFDEEAFIKENPPLLVPVSDFSLMKSERIKGRLTYTPLFTQELYEGE